MTDDDLTIPPFLRRDPATDPAHLRRVAREQRQGQPRAEEPPVPQRRQVPRRVRKTED
jgi:hypothetical protein